MAYLGNSPSLSRKQTFLYYATEGQTVFTGLDSRSNVLSFTPGIENVYVNGKLIWPITDYTVNSTGTSITIALALTLDDDVIIDALSPFSVADTYRKIETFERAQNFADVLNAQTARANLGLDSDVGKISVFAMSTAPANYLKANGATISRTTYAKLFAKISTTFGVGDGSTTFTLPDLRGEFIRGWDDARGVDSGRGFGSFQNQAFLSHTHSVTDPSHNHPLAGGSNAPGSGTVAPAAQSGIHSSIGGISSAYTGISIVANGGSETRPRNVALLFCIKYQE